MPMLSVYVIRTPEPQSAAVARQMRFEFRAGRHGQDRENVEAHFAGPPTVEGLMRAARVAYAAVSGQSRTRLGHVREGAQVDLLVLDAALQSLDEHLVDLAAPAVHADGDAGVLQNRGRFVTRELLSLVGVKDPGFVELRQRTTRSFTHKSAVGTSASRRARNLRLATSRIAAST